MKVKSKITGDVYTVYNVRDDKVGYPQFLIYGYWETNSWNYVSAKHFESIEY
jgi:hypothetical protein